MFIRIALASLMTLALVLAFPSVPAAALTGTITLNMTEGNPGGGITVTGTGFTPRQMFSISLGTAIATSGSTDASGNFSISFAIPAIARNTYPVTVITASGDTSNAPTFSVTPQIELSTTRGRAGDRIIVSGSGFTASYPVTLFFDATVAGSATADASGSFKGAIATIPSSVKGNHSFTASDAIGASPGVTFIMQEPQVSLSPGIGHVSEKFVVSGSGFLPGSPITITFDSATVASGTADGAGNFSGLSATVPSSARGSHKVTAKDSAGAFQTVNFETLQGMSINPQTGAVGDKLTVAGSGFAASSSVTITIDGQPSGSQPVKSDASGGFSIPSFTIPSISSGEHEMAARDASNNSASAKFTVDQKMNVTASSLASSEQVTISGSGFAANSNVTLSIDGKPAGLAAAKTETSGSFTYNLGSPAIPGGTHQLTATDTKGNVASASLSVTQKITIEPAGGIGGTKVNVRGAGFTAGKAITVKYNNAVVKTEPAVIFADDGGSFRAVFTAPPGQAGTITVRAEDGTQGANATFNASFEAGLTPVTTELSPGYVGMQMSIKGSGFKPSSKLTISISSAESKLLPNATSDAAGVFSASFIIPPVKGGTHTVIATDGTNSKQFTLVVESRVPAPPKLISPEPRARVKQPPALIWTEVTDLSGISYFLQVASDKDFHYLELEKTSLTTAAYTPAGSEKLRATSKDRPYYWRVKAVDGTLSESAWSDISEFYTGGGITVDGGIISIGASTSLPIWLFALLCGIGFIMVIAIAFMVGRRLSSYD
jgi:hypothetical protein